MVEEPDQKFRNLTEAVVLAALVDPDPENPISCEVRRLVSAWSVRMREGGAVTDADARWPIEAIAIRIARETFMKKAKA